MEQLAGWASGEYHITEKTHRPQALLENDSSITGTMCASVKARYRGNNGGQGMSRTRTNFCGWGQEGPLVEYP